MKKETYVKQKTLNLLGDYLEKQWRKKPLTLNWRKNFRKELKEIVEASHAKYQTCVFWHLQKKDERDFQVLLKKYGFNIPEFYSIIIEKNYCGVTTEFQKPHKPICGNVPTRISNFTLKFI